MKGIIFFLSWMWLSASFSTSLSALQHGALSFMQYCSGCHSLEEVRYVQLFQDLKLNGLTRQQLSSIYLPNDSQHFRTNLTKRAAMSWFGRVPLDLSLIAEVRGRKWLTNYLQDFYLDSKRPYGVNNHTLPFTAMPDVLSSLRRGRNASPQELQQTITDIVLFLEYTADPTRSQRQILGVGVCGFLIMIIFIRLWYNKIFVRKERS